MKGPGLVHIYTGDGKGKTTASVGLAVRACGRGFRVLFVQFLKGMETGELAVFEGLRPRIEVMRTSEAVRFTWQMNEDELRAEAARQSGLFEQACRRAINESFDMVVLDEIMAAVNTGMIAVERVAGFIGSKPESLEVVLTGRNAPGQLIEIGDYVSEVRMVKHPYIKGIKARKGIES